MAPVVILDSEKSALALEFAQYVGAAKRKAYSFALNVTGRRQVCTGARIGCDVAGRVTLSLAITGINRDYTVEIPAKFLPLITTTTKQQEITE